MKWNAGPVQFNVVVFWSFLRFFFLIDWVPEFYHLDTDILSKTTVISLDSVLMVINADIRHCGDLEYKRLYSWNKIMKKMKKMSGPDLFSVGC